MACATRSIRAWAGWPWSEARLSRIGYNAPAPRGDGDHSTPSGDDKEGSMSRSLFQMVAVIMLLVVGATGCATVEDNPQGIHRCVRRRGLRRSHRRGGGRWRRGHRGRGHQGRPPRRLRGQCARSARQASGRGGAAEGPRDGAHGQAGGVDQSRHGSLAAPSLPPRRIRPTARTAASSRATWSSTASPTRRGARRAASPTARGRCRADARMGRSHRDAGRARPRGRGARAGAAPAGCQDVGTGA